MEQPIGCCKNVAVDPADQEPDNIVDWAAFALARGGYQIDGDYLQYIDGVVRANFRSSI